MKLLINVSQVIRSLSRGYHGMRSVSIGRCCRLEFVQRHARVKMMYAHDKNPATMLMQKL